MNGFLKSLSQDGWKRHLLAFLAGAITPLAFSPWGLWPIVFLTLPVFLATIFEASDRTSIRRAWFFGFGLYGSGVSWVYISIATYGYTPPVLAVPLTIIFTAGLGLLMPLQVGLWRYFPTGKWFVLGFPATWVIFEWFRSWFLTGFPWLYLGYAFIDTPLAGFAPVTGIYGLSFIVALTASSIFIALYSRKLKWLAACLVLWASGFALQHINWTEDSGEEISVAMMQGNIPQDLKWQLEMQDVTMDIYKGLTHPFWEKDLIVWPEAAIPIFYDEALEDVDFILEKTRENGNSLVTGIPYREAINGEWFFYNSILSINGANEKLPLHLYHKQKLVPFGEYIPLQGLLRGLIPFFNLPMSSFSAGKAAQTGLETGDYRIGAFICYEVVYPDFVKRYGMDSDFFITISNDAWFGASHGPHQHFQMARMRALEHGKYLLRATNTGITAIVGPKGKTISALPQFSRDILVGEIRATKGFTPFSLLGSTPVIALCLICWIVCWRREKTRSVQV